MTRDIGQKPSATAGNGRDATGIAQQGIWFAGGLAVGFAMPFIFTSVLEIHHDLYYLVYFMAVLGFLGSYVHFTGFDYVGMFRRAWLWSLLLSVPVTAFVVGNVLSRDSTPGPEGTYAAFEALWRGITYGVVDALLLTAFPGAIALTLLGGELRGRLSRVKFAALSLVMSILITGVYHLGYEQFREDGIGPPEVGNTIMSIPMLATGNPLGSVIAHASMHVTADVHSYETDIFLPPQTDAP